MVYQIYAGYTVEGVRIKMPQVYMPNLVRSTIKASGPDGILLHQLHFHTDNASPSEDDCLAVNDMLDAWIHDSYLGLVTNLVLFDFIHTRGMDAYTAYTNTRSLGPVAGTLTGDSMPSQMSLVARFGTALTGRSKHGRAYTFPPSETVNDVDGQPIFTYVGDVVGLWIDLMLAARTAGYPLVIASYTRQSLAEVTSITVDSFWDTQTRRGRERGR